MIKLEAVSKTYEAKTVLHPVSLELAAGQTHVFWGSSGSGKSTLLRILSGLIDATSGRVFVDEIQVSSARHHDLASKIGYVIQEGGLFPHLTAFENLALATRWQKWSAQKVSERVKVLADLVQLSSAQIQRFPKELSGGQRQRVALMRALMLDPKLVLLDEPLGALDPLVRSDLQRELKNIFNELKKTVVLVTHDISEGASFGHTISLFDDGSLIQHGEFSSFIKAPANDFVTRFVRAHTPPAELLEAWR